MNTKAELQVIFLNGLDFYIDRMFNLGECHESQCH